MAEFEEIMAGDDEEVAADDEEQAFDDEEDMMESDDEEDETDESVMEAIALKNVPGLYGSKIGGDNGANAKSIALKDPRVKVAGVAPVKFSGDSEAVPTSPKAPSNYGSKGETQVKGAGSFKNAPAQNNFSEKGEKAPAPVKSQASGVNTSSPVAESRSAKKRIKSESERKWLCISKSI
jgi:hypothetical protein